MELTREVEWDWREQALMLALARYRARCCAQGHYLPESADPASEDHYRAETVCCHACTAASREAERVRDNPQPLALLHRVTRK